MTDYAYVCGLHFWADITTQGKIISKIFQRDGVLLSDVTTGVEDAEYTVGKLATVPGKWMSAFDTDYDRAKLALDGIELHSVPSGQVEYAAELADVCRAVADEMNKRFCTLLNNPVLKASIVFEHARWPSFSSSRSALDSFGISQVTMLLKHYDNVLGLMGCESTKVLLEWRRLKLHIARDPNLNSMQYAAMWERLFDQYSNKDNGQHFYNILLIVAVVHCFAIDTSICERGFSTMNMLKTARRNNMSPKLLRILMVICSLAGKEWSDPEKIPVQDIIELWRENSKKGRYEGALWDMHAGVQ